MVNVDNTDNVDIGEYSSPFSLFQPSSPSMLGVYFEESSMEYFEIKKCYFSHCLGERDRV